MSEKTDARTVDDVSAIRRLADYLRAVSDNGYWQFSAPRAVAGPLIEAAWQAWRRLQPHVDDVLRDLGDTAFRLIRGNAETQQRSDPDGPGFSWVTSNAKAMGNFAALLPAVAPSVQPVTPTSDTAPNFVPLASDQRMQQILERRWRECVACIGGGAYLAAVVMMGGLLESLFVSRANRLADKGPLINATRAPKRRGKTLPLQEWTLSPYIEVGHELGWICRTVKDVGMVLRDYRNFIHPQQEYAQQVCLTEPDARVMWEVTKALADELLRS